MSSAGRKEKLPSGRRRAEKSVTHGMTEDADPWSQSYQGGTSVNMGRVALGWCWRANRLDQEGAVPDEEGKALLGWPSCSQPVRTTRRGNHPMKVAFPGLWPNLGGRMWAVHL